jgi:hypothetical protein
MMTSQLLLTEMQNKGLTVQCVNNKLQVKPAHLIDGLMADLIKLNKAELIQLLNTEREPTNHWWVLHFKDAQPMQVCTLPHSTQSEMLAYYPRAIAAEPIPSPIDETTEAQAP